MNSTAAKTLTLVAALCLVAGALAGAILFHFNPERTPIYPVCTFHQITGLDCPGCGGLRSMHQLLHGHWREALRLNAFVVLSLPLWMGVAIHVAWRYRRGDRGISFRLYWLWLYLGAWLVFAIVRNLPGFRS